MKWAAKLRDTHTQIFLKTKKKWNTYTLWRGTRINGVDVNNI